ncbi:ATX1 antioxidant protein 1 [Mactra antiquata]
MTDVIHEFSMEMSCEGCCAAAKRVLGEIGVDGDAVVTNLETKTVIVTTDASVEKLLEALKKTGNEIQYIGVKE